MLAKKCLEFFSEPFRTKSGFDIPLILVFASVNFLVFVNAVLHPPEIGYDAIEHLRYIHTLSEAHLVRPQDSLEFFGPPLPYLIPAFAMAVDGGNLILAAKFGQLINVFLSIGTTFYLVKTAHILNPEPALRLGALVFLGTLPVFYRTFAFIRGEPYVALFAMMILYYFVVIFPKRDFGLWKSILLGVAMGLCALSRQWGILLFPAIVFSAVWQCLWNRELRASIAKTLYIAFGVATLISGWFYLLLYDRFGSATAFNLPASQHLSFSNQATEFYTGLGAESLFHNPVRPSFTNRLIPVFYSEIWGDYWCYFAVYGKDTRTDKFLNGYTLSRLLETGARPDWLETNLDSMKEYLGRVNMFSLFPSAIAAASIGFALLGLLGCSKTSRTIDGGSTNYSVQIIGFCLMAVASSWIGYSWFLIRYPQPQTGITIKATYMLQIFPFVAIIVGSFLERIKRLNSIVYWVILLSIIAVFAHNISAAITHYVKL